MVQLRYLSLLCVFFLLGCAGDETPVALQTIDSNSFYRQMIVGSDEMPMRLIDAVVKQGVKRKVATEAFLKYDRYRGRVNNAAYITILDFSQHSSKRRFYMINRVTGKVDSLTTAHGTASDPDKDGHAQYFSNIPDSRMSSLGSYLVAERYVGKYGPSLRLDGLEETNSNVRARTIVLHPSNYVKDGKPKQGWSWGCPAVPYAWIDTIISRLRDGSFMYAYGVNKYVKTANDFFWESMSLKPGFKWTDESEEAPEDGELSSEEMAQ